MSYSLIIGGQVSDSYSLDRPTDGRKSLWLRGEAFSWCECLSDEISLSSLYEMEVKVLCSNHPALFLPVTF